MSEASAQVAGGGSEAGEVVTVLARLRALTLSEARAVLGRTRDEPTSKQHVWQILHGTGANKRGLTTRLLARAVARLGIGEPTCPLRATLLELYPEEFAA